MGRNTPMYHYTGSEDIVQFNVSWYCDDPDNPAEVLTKCRLLESWSKSNAYQAAPPILQIQWGNSDTLKVIIIYLLLPHILFLILEMLLDNV